MNFVGDSNNKGHERIMHTGYCSLPISPTAAAKALLFSRLFILGAQEGFAVYLSCKSSKTASRKKTSAHRQNALARVFRQAFARLKLRYQRIADITVTNFASAEAADGGALGEKVAAGLCDMDQRSNLFEAQRPVRQKSLSIGLNFCFILFQDKTAKPS